MLLPLFGAFFSFVLLQEAAALQSSDLTEQDVIDFLTKGHVVLRNVLPELRDESFRKEYEHAKTEASKAYERFFIDFVECNKPDFVERVEAGDGAQVMKDCVDYKFQDEGGVTDDDSSVMPFYQIVNLHEYSQQIRDVATGPRLASIVSDLLRVERVRLYQSRTFRKVPNEDDTMRILFNHPTFMHADLSMVPLDTNEYLTLWCPSRNLTQDDSVLTYASGSHRDLSSRHWYDTAPPDMYEDDEDEDEDESEGEGTGNSTSVDSEEDASKDGTKVEIDAGTGDAQSDKASETESEAKRIEEERLAVNEQESMRYDIDWYDGLRVGDCVAHHGWLLHGATSQVFESGPRDAITFAYIDGDAHKLASKEERHGYEFMDKYMETDSIMFRDWYYDIPDGEVVDHPKLPLVWPTQQENQDEPVATS